MRAADGHTLYCRTPCQDPWGSHSRAHRWTDPPVNTFGNLFFLKQVMKPLPEFAFQPHGPTFPMELPKLNVPGASKTVPFPTLKFQSVFPTPVNGGKLPIIPSVKYIDTKVTSISCLWLRSGSRGAVIFSLMC